MKIIYCADIRGDYARLYTLLKETIADIYIVSGNLTDMPFYSNERFSRYIELQNIIHNLAAEAGKNVTCDEHAESIIADPSSPEIDKSHARELLDLTEKAEHTMLKKYTRLEAILSTKPYVPIIALPGCTDLRIEKTELAARSIDHASFTSGALTFAGSGGAAIRVSGFPEKITRYHHPDTDSGTAAFLENINALVLAGAIPCAPSTSDNPAPFSLLSKFSIKNSLPLMLCGASEGFIPPWIEEKTAHIASPLFGDYILDGTILREGGFFYEILFDDLNIRKMILKKISADRVYDIAEFQPEEGSISAAIIDSRRFDALKSGELLDSRNNRTPQIPELRLFRDIRNFFKIHQTRETEHKVETLAKALETLGEEYSDIALDLVGSTNIGIAQKSSDVDMVLYIRGGDMCLDEEDICSRFDEVEQRIRDIVGDSCDFELIDHVNLDLVEDSIRRGDCESPVLQRFVVYRGMCRPVNYRVLAPIEDMLNADENLRVETEKSMSEYLQVFGTTKDTNRSFDKYQTRLRSMGVEIPKVIENKIRMFLQK